jgi:hypothetical protein
MTLFFSENMQKIAYFFSYNLAAGTLSSVFNPQINFLLKFYFASIISVCSTPLGKKGGSGYGKHKNMRIRFPNTASFSTSYRSVTDSDPVLDPT